MVVAPNVVMGSVEAMAVVGGAVVVMSGWKEHFVNHKADLLCRDGPSERTASVLTAQERFQERRKLFRS